jgi:hypothetical protein
MGGSLVEFNCSTTDCGKFHSKAISSSSLTDSSRTDSRNRKLASAEIPLFVLETEDGARPVKLILVTYFEGYFK